MELLPADARRHVLLDLAHFAHRAATGDTHEGAQYECAKIQFFTASFMGISKPTDHTVSWFRRAVDMPPSDGVNWARVM